MKVAVACDELHISECTARCDSFMCYTIDRGVLIECRNLPNMSTTNDEITDLLIELDFDAIISDGIDFEIADKLCEAGIEVIVGAQGTPREAVEDYINNKLTGAVSLCDIDNNGDTRNDSSEDDIDSVFAHITEQFSTTT